ncbi:2-amino-4-hydroxy-6-hydroxymethyldihydropteridine diphosphokinase [Simiduia agarivorans]|uniref:2-amino-4-hydroxy-6-hydroxymethyldihydropteridine pyrophosphokinase n=1 Tax=Simiduia agarivorans (strain DSM 21679 / JCM 13881 / BCRC 17597 / SA1) TaxID=1117647 RepID=K4KHT6_SIMAS|nr:2-amino-4-hydroxy-6- hydroxymethyldihydropteridine pyrophosphokinase [Simiduia agarivorans SA1 = DSM 21679]
MAIDVAIGLGSNLDDPVGQIEQALGELNQLPGTRLINASPLYGSKAVGPAQPDYVNACARLQTTLAPLALLDALQALEQSHRRVRKIHWGPRTLDLDLLLYGDQRINLPRLTVPHAFLTERNFVLYPLADVWPDARLPDGRTLDSLLAVCTMEGLWRLGNEKE